MELLLSGCSGAKITGMSPDDVIRDLFPNLRASGHKITSEDTRRYNCLAWAAGETHRRWDWHLPYHWPATRRPEVEYFMEAYASIGYVECDNGDFEHGFEKIAIYGVYGWGTHAARQLGNDKWTSKLGNLEDIEHPTLNGLEDSSYGRVEKYMKRPIILKAGITPLINPSTSKHS
jgi:hypothetical protein